MAISKMFYKNIEYYRITRTWDYKNTEIQEYVRVGSTAKQKIESKAKAEAIDATLKQRQVIDKLLKQNNCEIYFHPTGKVVGINRVSSTLYRPPYEVHIFTVRYNPRNGKHARHGSVSIEKHGLEHAYEIAVQKLTAFANIDDNKPLIKLMQESFKYYSFDPTLKKNQKYIDGRGKYDPHAKDLETRLRIDFKETEEKLGIASLNNIEGNLLKELELYQRDNPAPQKKNSRNINAW